MGCSRLIYAIRLQDEPLVARWEEYAQEAQRIGVVHALVN